MNNAFLAKAIDRAQHMVIGEPFCDAIHEFIAKAGVVVFDAERALFWVKHPNGGWQVAVWLMPVVAAA